jgi:NAD(P)-dependent dehydrogenase (short-subunit alcohol dehydrogenase family)
MATPTTVALITGGNRGLGRETARQLARRGVTVIIGSRDAAAGKAVAGELSSDGTVKSLRPDVTDEASAAAALNEIERGYGRPDVLVNNAGRIIEEEAASTTAAQLQVVFATNTFGAATMIRLALPL